MIKTTRSTTSSNVIILAPRTSPSWPPTSPTTNMIDRNVRTCFERHWPGFHAHHLVYTSKALCYLSNRAIGYVVRKWKSHFRSQVSLVTGYWSSRGMSCTLREFLDWSCETDVMVHDSRVTSQRLRVKGHWAPTGSSVPKWPSHP